MKSQKSKVKSQNCFAKKSLQNITVANVGHIDHGKSTLLGRLLYDSGQVKPDKIAEMKKSGNNLAFLMDSFEDEQKGEMTIDIFYTQFCSQKFQFTLIDDPGHLEFVKNMLTGVSQASGVILVVSAKEDEGIQFQTKRHLMLVKLLGIQQILVVINKMDLANYSFSRFQDIKNEIRQFLTKIGYPSRQIPFIPVSATVGDNVYHSSKNLAWYHGPTFYQALDQVFTPPAKTQEKPLRLFFQGAFSQEGQKILFSRLESGQLKIGQKILFQPQNLLSKVLAIKASQPLQKTAFPGEAVGLIVDRFPDGDVHQQVAGPKQNPPRTVTKVKAEIFLLLDQPLQKEEPLLFRCGPQEKPCQISQILRRINSETGRVLARNAFQIKPAEMADVEISFPAPIVVEKFTDFPSLGRFLLFKGKKNLAAGITIS